MDMSNHPIAKREQAAAIFSAPSPFDNLSDPDLNWSLSNPDRALALLFVSPRPCAALDRLMGA